MLYNVIDVAHHNVIFEVTTISSVWHHKIAQHEVYYDNTIMDCELIDVFTIITMVTSQTDLQCHRCDPSLYQFDVTTLNYIILCPNIRCIVTSQPWIRTYTVVHHNVHCEAAIANNYLIVVGIIMSTMTSQWCYNIIACASWCLLWYHDHEL